jgi:hypothetical protein
VSSVRRKTLNEDKNKNMAILQGKGSKLKVQDRNARPAASVARQQGSFFVTA